MGELCMEYAGNRWFKCDFHIHTTFSECFKDKSVTNEQWMERVKEQQLDCVAVTDHNDYRNIDALIELGKKNGIVVFPGVEVTCDSARIHLLVLFDVDAGGDKVRDFLCKVDIDGEKIGKSLGTSTSVFEVCKRAKEMGALVIAAHIDDFHGINIMSTQHLKKILSQKYLDGVEVGNQEIWETCEKNAEEMSDALNRIHSTHIQESDRIRWEKTYKIVKEMNFPIVVFSDNISGEGEATHGLWGIGKQYTWIKMDKEPNLESLRQSLLGSDVRIKTYVQSFSIPEKNPLFWIKSVQIKKSQLSPYKTLAFEFNPHLNCIIGESGSGKSSILRLITGILGEKKKDSFRELQREQDAFYCRYSENENLGIFLEETQLEIEVCYNDAFYKIEASNVKNTEEQDIKVYEFYENDFSWEYIGGRECLARFGIQSYMQNQVREIAKNPIELIPLMDASIAGIEKEKIKKKAIIEEYKKLCENQEAMIDTAQKKEMYHAYKDCIQKINFLRKRYLKKILANRKDLSVSIKENICIDCDGKRFDKPENEIHICYKTEKSLKFKPISALAAGQKIAAIWKIVLSEGTSPLLLDQPEDGLDNRFVYELVAKWLKQNKQIRQIITTSHSPNILINSEPEYIISLGAYRKNVKQECAGSLDKKYIRKEVCKIAEGTEEAFEKRMQKYHIISAE